MTDSHRIDIDDRGIATLTIAGRKALNIVSTPAITTITATLHQLADHLRRRGLVLRGHDDRA